MTTVMTVNVHLRDDTRITAGAAGPRVWISVGNELIIFIRDENDLQELAGAIDAAAKLLL